MKRLLMVVGMALLGPSVSTAQGSRVVGVWELDVKASTLPDQFPAISETRNYTLREDGYLVVLAVRFDQRGRPEFIQVAAKSDGKDYPQYQSGPLAELQIKGTSTPFTYAETVVDENSVEVIARWNGRVTNRGTRNISNDGKTMTMELKAVAPDGRETPIVLVFRRLNE